VSSPPSLCPDRGTTERSCTPLRVPCAAEAPVHRMPQPLCPAGSTPGPRARANTRAPPIAPRSSSKIVCPHVSGPNQRLAGSQKTNASSTSTCSPSRRFNGAIILESYSCRFKPGFRVGCSEPCAPAPFLTATYCPDCGTAERSCTSPSCAACSPSTSASHPVPTLPGRHRFCAPSARTHAPPSAPLALTWPMHTF
jgi:hypothetical protein